MAAPKGNKYAVGHGRGRPRTVCPEDDELITLGKELLAWCHDDEENKKLHVSQWYSGEKLILESVWVRMVEKEVFRVYYETALRYLSIKYLDGTINPTIAGRFLRLYFGDLRKSDNELLKLKAELARKQEELTEDDLARKLSRAIKEIENDK